MKRQVRFLALALSAVLLLGLLSGCGDSTGSDNSGGSGEETYELSLSIHDPATSNKTIYFQQWADEIETASDGRIKITVYSGGALATGTAALDALRTQVCDIAWIYPQYFPDQFPLSEIVSQPIGITSVPQGVQVLYGLYEKYPELQNELSEFVPLMIHTNPTNKICSTEANPVYSVDDLKGLSYRASAGTPSDLLLAWGATPIQMAPGDIYQAVQKGTVDGFIFDWSGMVSFGLQEVTKYLVTYPVYCGPYYLMMNRSSFDALPEDLQNIILEHSGLEASLGLSWVYEYDENRGYEACIAAGCEPIDLTAEAEAEFESYNEGLLDTWEEANKDKIDTSAYISDAVALAQQHFISSDKVQEQIAGMDLN